MPKLLRLTLHTDEETWGNQIVLPEMVFLGYIAADKIVAFYENDLNPYTTIETENRIYCVEESPEVIVMLMGG